MGTRIRTLPGDQQDELDCHDDDDDDDECEFERFFF
jgi:hypothetical protein